MRHFLIATIVCCASSLAYAESCALSAPPSETLAYEQGVDLPIFTGSYQFNLPAKPNALLAFDGVMAVFPERRFVSYQLISNDVVAETLSRFSSRTLSAAALDRYLYGLDAMNDLSIQDQQIIHSLRADLKLDCHSRLTRYVVGDNAEVIFQAPSGSDGEYRLLYFTGELTHLVTVKGTKEQAIAVLRSVRKRTL